MTHWAIAAGAAVAAPASSGVGAAASSPAPKAGRGMRSVKAEPAPFQSTSSDLGIAVNFADWKKLGYQLDWVGFPFPGEPGGIYEVGALHDWVHVLTDYNTSPEGEIDVFAFIAATMSG